MTISAPIVTATAAAGSSERAGLEIRMRAADGSSRWINWSLRSIPEEDAVYLVGRDVSERKRSEQELEGLLESASDATCVIDEGGTIVRVAAQLERMFGYLEPNCSASRSSCWSRPRCVAATASTCAATSLAPGPDR